MPMLTTEVIRSPVAPTQCPARTSSAKRPIRSRTSWTSATTSTPSTTSESPAGRRSAVCSTDRPSVVLIGSPRNMASRWPATSAARRPGPPAGPCVSVVIRFLEKSTWSPAAIDGELPGPAPGPRSNRPSKGHALHGRRRGRARACHDAVWNRSAASTCGRAYVIPERSIGSMAAAQRAWNLPLRSGGGDRLQHVPLGRQVGRHHRRRHAGQGRNQDGEDDRLVGDGDVADHIVGDGRHRGPAEQHSQSDAQQRPEHADDDRLPANHPPHLLLGGADRPEQPDLPGPLHHRQDDGVDDADEGHEQGEVRAGS